MVAARSQGTSWAELLAHLPTDWALIPLDGRKRPVDPSTGDVIDRLSSGEEGLAVDDLAAFDDNRHVRAIGVLTGPRSGGLLAVDFDGPEGVPKFHEVFGKDPTALPRTIGVTSGKPKRGQRFFTVDPDWWPSLAKRKLWPGSNGKACLELRWDGHQSVIAGAHPETEGYRWLPLSSPADIPDPAPAPDWLLEALLIQEAPEIASRAPQADDADRAQQMLAAIPAASHSSYDPWLRVGMALHHTDPGLLAAWCDWSRQMPNFDEAECLAKWESFGKGHKGRPATIGTLFKLATDHGWQPPARPAPAPVAGAEDRGQQQPIPLTEAQRFELLRGRAAQVITEHPRKVEQELAMRMAATDLELPPLGPQQIRSLLWEARNGDAGPVQPLTPDQPLSLAPTPWLLENIVMAGALNLIVALPKVGKTAWALGFLGAWAHGQRSFLGCDLPPTPCPPLLIVGTDQPENDWGRMLKQFGLLDHTNRLHHRILGLFTAGRPLHLDAEGIDRIATYAEDHPGLLVFIDSLHACISPLGLKEESAEVAEPVRDLMSALEPHGATVLLVHHANKARANDGAVAASRGSTALPAVASQMISLTRFQAGAAGQPDGKERRLILKTQGRGGMDHQLLIERSDTEGWICHGDADAALEVQAREQARERLTDRQKAVLRLLCTRAKDGETTTPADVARELDLPRQRALDALGALVQKRLAIKATGTPTAADGGRPPATYSPVPDACVEP